MNKYFKIFMALPKTVYYNIKLFGIKRGIGLPIYVGGGYKIKASKGSISIPSQSKRFMIKFGLNEGTKSIAVADEGCIDIEDGGKLIFEGNADFKPGCKIVVKSKGVLEIGANFTCNRNGLFSVDAPVCIGEDALLGWNVKLRTSDGHPIYEIEDESKEINPAKPINIGNHVWIAADVDILKGVKIPSNCVIGYRSCVTKSIQEENCVIAGYPAKIVKRDIMWRRDHK